MENSEKEIREIFKLITSYAVDFFNVKSLKEIKKIDRTLFINKCHEGFYLAQDRIIANLLRGEEELKNIEKQIKNCKMGKHEKELTRSQSFHRLIDEKNKVDKEILLFKRLADSLAWTILKFDKIAIRGTQTNNDFHGYLSDKNIDPVLAFIKKIKKESGKFCLINDITSCMGSGAGDLTCIDKGQIIFQEIKTGKTNKEIMDFIDYCYEYMGKNPEVENCEKLKYDTLGREKFLNTHKDYIDKMTSIFGNKHKHKQFERMHNQLKRMQSVVEYNQKGVGVDIRLDKYGKESGKMKIMHEAKEIKDDFFFDIIEREFSHLSASKSEFNIINFGKFLYFLLSDNQVGEIFNLENSRFVREKNAQHLIFHAFNENTCKYLSAKTKEEWKDAFGKEFLVYQELLVFNWMEQIIKDGTLCPPYLFPFDEELIFDLLFERKSIFVYFDCERFVKFVKSIRLDFLEMENSGKISYKWSNIEFKANKNDNFKMIMGWGRLFRMMFEFQDVVSFLNQEIEFYNQERR